VTNRGGKGVKTMNISEKTGNLIAIKAVTDEDDLMITNQSGIVIRIPATDIRVMGRATSGVKVIKIDDHDKIADVTIVGRGEEEELDDISDAIIVEE
jgi:DNA gyrase subunit A